MKNTLLKLIPSLPIAMGMIVTPVALSSCHKTDPISINTKYPKDMKSYIVEGSVTTQTRAYFITNKPLEDVTVSCEIISGNFKLVNATIDCVNTSIKVTLTMKSTNESFVTGDKCNYSLIFNSDKGKIKNYKFTGFTLEMMGPAPKIITTYNNVQGQAKPLKNNVQISNLFTLDQSFSGEIRLANGFEAQETQTNDEPDTLTVVEDTFLSCDPIEFTNITFYGETKQLFVDGDTKTYHVSTSDHYELKCYFHPSRGDINDFEFSKTLTDFSFDINVSSHW